MSSTQPRSCAAEIPLGYGKCQKFIHEIALSYKGSDCLIWPYSRDADGYGKIQYSGVHTGAHRVVCVLSHGQQPSEGVVVAHSCGNGHLGCVNPLHLSWKTFKQNSADAVAHGTTNRGERCWTARLSDQKIRLIRRLAKTTSQKAIAKKFGLSSGHVSKIIGKRIWKHVD